MTQNLILASKTHRAVRRLASGARAFHILKNVTLYHRIQASPGLQEAVEAVRSYIEESLPDATSKIYTYGRQDTPPWLELPVGWMAGESYVEVEGERYTLSAHPTLAAAHTPGSDGVVRGRAHVNENPLDPSSYEKRKDAIHVVTRHHRLAYRLAAEAGVAGLILAHPDRHRDAFPYIGLFLTPSEASRYSVPAVTLPWSIASRLEGKTVSIMVEAAFSQPLIPVLEAVLWGSPGDRGPALMAHICHPRPGANDNASGVSAAIEAFHAVYEAVESGLLETPDTPIRLLLFPEYTGSIIHFHSKGVPTASLNLDMVGRRPGLAGRPRLVYTPPTVGPSVIGEILYDVLATGGHGLPGPDGYMWGSDHDVALYMGGDSVMVNQWPDPYYHTDRDDADMVSPTLLGEVASYAAAAVYLDSIGYRPGRKAAETVASSIAARHEDGQKEAYGILAWAYGLPGGREPKEDKTWIEARKPLIAWMLSGPENLDEKILLTRKLEETRLPGEARLETLYAAVRGVNAGVLKRLLWASHPGSPVEDIEKLIEVLVEHGFIEVKG